MAATSCEQDMDAVANTMEALSHLSEHKHYLNGFDIRC